MGKQILEVTMGQGVVANLDKYELYSGEFKDCSPIVMFNKADHRCGLFHFFAGEFKEQSQSLTEMAVDVKPTLIHIYKGEVGAKKSTKERREADGKLLNKLFHKYVVKDHVGDEEEYGAIYVTLKEGKLEIAAQCLDKRTKLNPKDTPKDARLFDDDWRG